MTDHWSPEIYSKSPRGLVGGTLFVAGAEFQKNDGVTLITFPLSEKFAPSASWAENLKRLKAMGAAVFGAHIEFSRPEQLAELDGIEAANLHEMALERNKASLIWTYIRAWAPWNWNLAFIVNKAGHLKVWGSLEDKTDRAIPAFAGSDTHDGFRLWGLFGPKLASYDRTFRIVTTHAWAKELTEEAIVEALRHGRGYFAFEIFGPSDGFRFYLSNGTNFYLPGDTATLEKNVSLSVELPRSHKNAVVRVIRNGKQYAQFKQLSSDATLLRIQQIIEPGIYRVEITNGGKPWIYSNAIRVTGGKK